jgi:BclA C-terminal domain
MILSEHEWNRSSPAYGYITLIGTAPILVRPGETIKFNQNGPLKNIKFTPPSDTLKVRESGDYRIEFTLLIDGPASTSVYGLILNDSLVSGELTNFGIQRLVDGATLMLIGQAIIHIPKKSTLQLRNIGRSTDTLLPILDGQRINAASLTIVKLS